MNLSLPNKFKISLFVFFLLFTVHCSQFTTSISAQVPGFKVPCDVEKDPEFNSLRPYQASPCGDSPKAYFCNNNYILQESVSTPFDEGACTPSGNQYLCPCTNARKCDFDKNYLIDGEGPELPILGNTEDPLDDATKMNEYLSWYLNGTNYRAENTALDNSIESQNKIINFSGPINKLTPSVILEAQRINSIKQATEQVTYLATEDTANPQDTAQQVTEEQNHNQIVVCGEETILWNWGETIPKECYTTRSDRYRLKDWEKDLSDFNNLVNRIGGDAWNKRSPPLPWSDENGVPFPDSKSYQKAYNEWRGEACLNIPIINQMFCFDNPFVANKWAKLFPYIPLANTVDKNAKHFVSGVGIVSKGQTEAVLDYEIIHEPVLFYAHTLETFSLTNQLKSLFKPQKEKGIGSNTFGGTATDYEQNACKIVNVRSNPGDQLFPSSKDGRSNDLEVNAHILVTQIACPAGPIDKYLEALEQGTCSNNCRPNDTTCDSCDKPDCEGDLYIEIRTVPKIPYIADITKETVTGTDSVFRRIFPKVAENAPVSCIADIPGVSNISYEAGPKTNLIRVENPTGAHDPASVPLYFPGLGTIYDYMLKGIQTALRPQGYGEPITNGTMCSALGGGDCSWNMAKINQGISDAASKYKVPASLLKAIFEIENADEINDNSIYQCTRPDKFGSIGVSQVREDLYKIIACPEEQMKDVGMCDNYPGKLSRCNFGDAFELMARALLYKAGRLSNCKPTGGIVESEKMVWYNASCDYYGLHTPTTDTIRYAQEIPTSQLRGGSANNMNYCDIVCWKMGQCPPYP